jgi:hypothetical protein
MGSPSEVAMQTPEQWQMEFDVLENAREAAQKRYNIAIQKVMSAMIPQGSGIIPPEAAAELAEAIKARDKTRSDVDDFIAALQKTAFA